jgi:hypothetical protein
MNARLTRRDCLDIMCTAVEGGIGYWSVVTDWKQEDDEHGVPDWLEVTIAPEAECEGDFEPTTVKYTAMRAAVARILNGEVRNASKDGRIARVIREAEDPGDIDADIADCIFQVAALGEVVYG